MSRTAHHVGRVLRDFAAFAWQNKLWWMLPLVATLLLLIALVVVGQSPFSPFVYTLF